MQDLPDNIAHGHLEKTESPTEVSVRDSEELGLCGPDVADVRDVTAGVQHVPQQQGVLLKHT